MAFFSREKLTLRRNACENLWACGQDRKLVLDFIIVKCVLSAQVQHL